MLASTQTELSFDDYQRRQHHEVSAQGLAARAARLEPGGKFGFRGGVWHPRPYVGHALVGMVAGSPVNKPLATRLAAIRNELSYGFSDPTALYFLPEESYHQTIANTLSDERHQRMVVERGLASTYPSLVTGVFADLPAAFTPTPLTMHMLGLGIFSSAIGLLGVFERDEDFQRIVHFRDHFYGHEQIGRLGIRRTRPFIGHITIAYVESPLDDVARLRLATTLGSLNRTLAAQPLPFHLPFAELRAYEHLAHFKALPHLPTYPL